MGEGISESEIEEEIEIEGVDSGDKVKHNERIDQLILEMMMKVAEQE